MLGYTNQLSHIVILIMVEMVSRCELLDSGKRLPWLRIYHCSLTLQSTVYTTLNTLYGTVTLYTMQHYTGRRAWFDFNGGIVSTVIGSSLW